MKDFAALVDRLVLSPQARTKVTLVQRFLSLTPDPERGFALAVLTGELTLKALSSAAISKLIAERTDPVLLAKSQEAVGDLAETASLLWPASKTNREPPKLSELHEIVAKLSRAETPVQVASWLDACDPATRWVLLKLLTGTFKPGISPRLVKEALAGLSSDLHAHDIEEVWHACEPPFLQLLQWVEGKAHRPTVENQPTFYPLIHPHPIETIDGLDPSNLIAEQDWEGPQVLLVQAQNQVRLYSAEGQDVSAAFPELCTPLTNDLRFQAKLLVKGEEGLQQRWGRKSATKAKQAAFPARLIVTDVLSLEAEDLRTQPLAQRRERLARWFDHNGAPLLEPVNWLSFETSSDLSELRKQAADTRGVKGLVLKPKDSLYGTRTLPSPWLQWKTEPKMVLAVLLYVERGASRNAPFGDFTFGTIVDDSETGEPVLVPLGKAPGTLSDEELPLVQAFVQDNTLERFGPVRSVRADLVFELAFDAVQVAKRRKSGIQLVGARLVRLRQDKPWQEADRLTTLKALLP